MVDRTDRLWGDRHLSSCAGSRTGRHALCQTQPRTGQALRTGHRHTRQDATRHHGHRQLDGRAPAGTGL